MNFHKIAELFPMMEHDEFESLVMDIKNNGLIEPIWTYQGQILDGRNRFLACQEAGIEPTYREYTGDNPLAFAVSLNIERRHLTPHQRACLAVEVLPIFEQAAKERQGTRTDITEKIPESSGEARVFAAEVFHVNPRYVSDAKKVKEGAPELFEVMKSGGLNIKEALHEIHERERAEKRAELMEQAEKQEAKEYDGYGVNGVYIADIKTIELPESSVDMIFTDPPYDKESIELFEALSRFAYRCLKPGAYLMTYTGKMFLPAIMNALGVCLEYVWEYGVFQPDSNHKIQKHHVFQAWRPILCYKKPGKTNTKNWQLDMIRGTRDKSFHEWQQQIELPLKYIEAYTLPGELVVDPFAGGGTTLAACKLLKRNYLGFDKDETTVKIAKLRLSQ